MFVKHLFTLKYILTLIAVTYVSVGFAQFGGGTGIERDPYLIETAEHLDNVRDYLDATFEQRADIDLSDYENWNPITTFSGVYDGNNYEIVNLTINEDSSRRALFGRTDSAVLKNIILTDVNITNVSTQSGSLIGRAINTYIVNCGVNGGHFYDPVSNALGGLIGLLHSGTVRNSWVDIEMITNDNMSGGLIGFVLSGGIVLDCFSIGRVETLQDWGFPQQGNVGGLVGTNMGVIRNSYSGATVVAPDNIGGIGGLVGQNTNEITGCYSYGLVRARSEEYVGGLVGENRATVIDSYWDIEASGLTESGGGEGRTTAEMTYPYSLENTYVRWPFNEIWFDDRFYEINSGYPILHFQYSHGEQLDTPIVEIEIRTIEEEDYVVLNWEPIEEANSYLVYDSADPNIEEWGEPEIVENNQFIQAVGNNLKRFYKVVAARN